MYAYRTSLGRKIWPQVLVGILLTGCASQYNYRADSSAASLKIAGNSKQFFVESHKDLSCTVDENGIRMATFYGPTANVRDHEQGTTVAVPTGKEMFLTFHYIDAKFALNRKCDMTVGFTPDAGAKYSAYFSVKPEVSGCDVTLKQEVDGGTKEVSSFHLAKHVCLNGRNVGPINGLPQRLHWKVEVIRVP